MKKIFLIIICSLLLQMTLLGQWKIDPKDYQISDADISKAEEMINSPNPKHMKFPNPRKGAQWFPDASLGLFMHWGIHSVQGTQPSWAMIKGYRWNGGYHSRQEYYGWANEFNPDYQPLKYLKAVKEAGFSYAVLTTRHHDGYALWPSRYGIGTKQYMNGRDLLKEYVAACHEAGLKVGFYYSPVDWHYPGFRPDADFDVATWGKSPVPEDNQQQYVKFLAYVMAQLEELMTNYGKIDVLWLDGMNWKGITEEQTYKIYAWIRSMQPDIVINDRWANEVHPDNPDGTSHRIGDFTTPFECRTPTYTPSVWFDHCDIWTRGGGGWGFDRTGTFKPLKWFLKEFVASREFGGNFLINVGPDRDGNMLPSFYAAVDSLKAWMSHSGESLEGAGPTPGVRYSNVPLTTKGRKIWYAHVLYDFKGEVSVMTGRAPKSVTLLRTGESIRYLYNSKVLTFKLVDSLRSGTDDVVKIKF